MKTRNEKRRDVLIKFLVFHGCKCSSAPPPLFLVAKKRSQSDGISINGRGAASFWCNISPFLQIIVLKMEKNKMLKCNNDALLAFSPDPYC